MQTTYIFIILNIIASIYAWSNPTIFDKWTMNPYLIHKKRQYYRFITSGFIHANYLHLIFNMLTLYFFGERVEYIFNSIFKGAGSWMYILLYLFAIIASDIPTFFKKKNQSYYNSVGASGGISAIVFASILFMPVAKLCLYAILCIPGFIFAVLYLIYSYYESRRNTQINHEAHFYGALAGILFCVITFPRCIMIFIEQVSQWKFF
jgi:membrane associated rhomboid family serine protease